MAEFRMMARKLLGVSLVRKQVIITVAVSFVALAAVIAIQTVDRVRDTYALQETSEVAMSALLAEQIAGAVKWEKVGVIEATYAPIAANPENSLAALTVFDAAGKPLAMYKSDTLPTYDLARAPI